ncbi:hypothetical protein ZIOFF_001230 [Zingiber officinale]|uniref:DDE Tnp4 domain-containing protein n=1 Tax=Zingiber officinale TaxID=94328 RepID=A0A8J5I2A5_ZINOF|nr:hypothetical protein ZIOFF_001230 [Zingiber officinale]
MAGIQIDVNSWLFFEVYVIIFKNLLRTENTKELFNLRHASLRNAIERIFGIFKSRFKIFKTAPPFPYTTQEELVLACARLHNFLRRKCHSDEFSIELDNEVPSSSSEHHSELSHSLRFNDVGEDNAYDIGGLDAMGGLTVH